MKIYWTNLLFITSTDLIDDTYRAYIGRVCLIGRFYTEKLQNTVNLI